MKSRSLHKTKFLFDLGLPFTNRRIKLNDKNGLYLQYFIFSGASCWRHVVIKDSENFTVGYESSDGSKSNTKLPIDLLVAVSILFTRASFDPLEHYLNYSQKCFTCRLPLPLLRFS